MKRIQYFVFLLLIILSVNFIGCDSREKRPVPLLLISFDGFKYDYFEKTETPNFDSFIASGVKADGLISVFPTKTFPNHYSIATGLYPENSGLISNNIYDPQLDQYYAIRDRAAVENPVWYDGEPVWNTVEKNGLNAGTLFWVGSEAPVQNMRPTFWKKYDGGFPEEARIDTVVQWFTRKDMNRVDFATLYYSDVDSRGHRYGTESDSLIAAIENADRLMGYLKTKLEEANLWGEINIIVVSDHGMADLSADKVIFIDELIDLGRIQMVDWTPVAMFNPEPEYLDEAVSVLKQHESKGFRVFKKENLPERYHLKNHPRTPAVIMISDPGYTILTRSRYQAFVEGLPSATHGYDNYEKSMQGIFLASGPAFKQGLKIEPFENIHIYELMAKLLYVEPAPNNGNPDRLNSILTEN